MSSLVVDRPKVGTVPLDYLELSRVTEARNDIQAYAQAAHAQPPSGRPTRCRGNGGRVGFVWGEGQQPPGDDSTLRAALVSCRFAAFEKTGGASSLGQVGNGDGGVGAERGLLVEVGGDEAEHEAGDAEGRGVLVPDGHVDADRDDLADVAKDSEERRRNEGSREPTRRGLAEERERERGKGSTRCVTFFSNRPPQKTCRAVEACHA